MWAYGHHRVILRCFVGLVGFNILVLCRVAPMATLCHVFQYIMGRRLCFAHGLSVAMPETRLQALMKMREP